jgi:hypothetical protein
MSFSEEEMAILVHAFKRNQGHSRGRNVLKP